MNVVELVCHLLTWLLEDSKELPSFMCHSTQYKLGFQSITTELYDGLFTSP